MISLVFKSRLDRSLSVSTSALAGGISKVEKVSAFSKWCLCLVLFSILIDTDFFCQDLQA
jgi:hypothetical protein